MSVYIFYIFNNPHEKTILYFTICLCGSQYIVWNLNSSQEFNFNFWKGLCVFLQSNDTLQILKTLKEKEVVLL